MAALHALAFLGSTFDADVAQMAVRIVSIRSAGLHVDELVSLLWSAPFPRPPMQSVDLCALRYPGCAFRRIPGMPVRGMCVTLTWSWTSGRRLFAGTSRHPGRLAYSAVWVVGVGGDGCYGCTQCTQCLFRGLQSSIPA